MTPSCTAPAWIISRPPPPHWVGSSPSRAVSLLYVEFIGDGLAHAGSDGAVFEVLRVTNASTLDAPLTIATGWPMYTLGDYNTVGWQPSALVADVITFLSNAWSDATNAGPTWTSMPNASNTQCLLPSWPATPPRPATMRSPRARPSGNPGGLRELPPPFGEVERGNLPVPGIDVSLFNPQHALMPWYHRVYYAPPIRDWLFDTRFRDPANLPPGTPVVGNVLQTAYRPVH